MITGPVYTDGSFSTNGNFRERATTGGTVTATSAVVFGLANDRRAIRVSKGVRHTSAYTTELQAIQIASTRLLPGHTIHSDCLSAIAACQRFWDFNKFDGNKTIILAGLPRQKCELRKVSAHPERREPVHRWTTEDHGIFDADEVAGGTSHIPVYDIPAEQMLRDNRRFQPFTFQTNEIITDWARLRSECRISDYTSTRDRKRREKGLPEKWSLSARTLAARIWKTANITERARAIRIIWDKHCHGYNRIKWGCQADGTELCPLCGVVESQRYILTECRRPAVETARRDCIHYFQQAVRITTVTHPGTAKTSRPWSRRL
jgi:hypothetical protein